MRGPKPGGFGCGFGSTIRDRNRQGEPTFPRLIGEWLTNQIFKVRGHRSPDSEPATGEEYGEPHCWPHFVSLDLLNRVSVVIVEPS